jgi:hypothetical protein
MGMNLIDIEKISPTLLAILCENFSLSIRSSMECAILNGAVVKDNKVLNRTAPNNRKTRTTAFFIPSMVAISEPIWNMTFPGVKKIWKNTMNNAMRYTLFKFLK